MKTPSSRDRNLVVAAVMVATFLAALDTTIVDTAMPRIIGSLGGMSLYSWVFSAYLLTSTTTVTIYGKLSDIYGRKRMLLVGIALFVLGSALAGQSHTMIELILFRGLQGLGAGAVLPVTQTIIGDLFSLEERARMQGLFSSIWGFSAIVGPALGGLIVDHSTWRWIFYVNVPMGLAASWLLWQYFHEEIEVREHRVDYPGAILLTVGVLTLLLGLLQGGVSHPWTSPYILSLLVAAVVSLAAFLRVESRAAEPTLPLPLFQNPIISISNLAGFLAGAVMIGMTTYLPLFAQGVQGATATAAGAILAPLSIGWPIGSTVGGRIILRLGYRVSAVLGMAFDVAGAGVLLLVDRTGSLPLWVLMSLMFITGLGLGFSTLAFVLAIQNAVGWRQRGVATASAQFLRNLGSTLGVSLMGTVLNLRLIARLRALPEAMPAGASGPEILSRVNNLLQPETWPTLTPELLSGFRQALAQSLRGVHWMILAAALMGLAVAWFIPAGRAQDFAAPEDSPARGRAGEA